MGKREITLRTTVRFFTGVRSHMLFQIPRSWTWEITLCATVRLFPYVNSHMSGQARGIKTGIITLCTTVELLSLLKLDLTRWSGLGFSSLFIRAFNNVSSIVVKIASGPGVQYLDIWCWLMLIGKLKIFILFSFPQLHITSTAILDFAIALRIFKRLFSPRVHDNVAW